MYPWLYNMMNAPINMAGKTGSPDSGDSDSRGKYVRIPLVIYWWVSEFPAFSRVHTTFIT